MSALPDGRERLTEALRSWNLRAVDALSGGYNSLVLKVESEGSHAVLKLASNRASAAAEAVALRWWGDGTAPRVLRHDEELGALLLEMLHPGTALAWNSVEDSKAVVPLLRRLHQRDADPMLQLPRLIDVVDETLALLRANAVSKCELVDADLARRAQRLLDQLASSADSQRQVVLHGDAVPVNVLCAHDGLRIIDPRACIGDAAYDAAIWSVFSGYGHDGLENCTLLVDELGLDEERVLRWAWALAVSRLLQIADSPHVGHAPLCDSLRVFIAAASFDLDAS